MAQYNLSISVTFRENDGVIGWRVNPETINDYLRHVEIFGLWRTRWICFKQFWRALMWAEGYAISHRQKDFRKWVFRSEIPE